MQVKKMRLLRHKHNITRPELGRVCGLSPQRISEIELGVESMTRTTEIKLRRAFHEIASQRRTSLHELLDDLSRHEDSLLDAVEESEYEL